MNPHDMNHLPREATFMFARLFAVLIFGCGMFVVGYMSAELRFKADPPPCKPVVIQKQSAYPIGKAEVAKFVRQFRNQDAGFIK